MLVPIVPTGSPVMIVIMRPIVISMAYVPVITTVIGGVTMMVMIVLMAPFLVMFFLPAVVVFFPALVLAGMFPVMIPVGAGGKGRRYQSCRQ
jgi:hypothetical protein